MQGPMQQGISVFLSWERPLFDVLAILYRIRTATSITQLGKKHAGMTRKVERGR